MTDVFDKHSFSGADDSGIIVVARPDGDTIQQHFGNESPLGELGHWAKRKTFYESDPLHSERTNRLEHPLSYKGRALFSGLP
jgi:hypothetical protein